MKINTIEDIKRLHNESKLTHVIINNKCFNKQLSAYVYRGKKVKINNQGWSIGCIGFYNNNSMVRYLNFEYIDIEETEKLIKGEETMTKSDLKDGMVVELRNGDKYVVFLDKIMNISRYIAIYQYYDNLEADINIFDIVKIFKSEGWTLKNIFDDDNLTLIWKREEKSEAEIKLDTIEKQIEKLQKSAKELREVINNG